MVQGWDKVFIFNRICPISSIRRVYKWSYRRRESACKSRWDKKSKNSKILFFSLEKRRIEREWKKDDRDWNRKDTYRNRDREEPKIDEENVSLLQG